ncbi:MAG: hypothetical protein A3I97_00180 [Candidatus Taylorbacteria bacterium RIFCSPLOWO2_02_FULL_44_35]|nr:MAG: hypothetical protein A3I97_00180 [Candidatus Taylorbacteria bacterium RIFCSPLOWO2_02_FULL_44_35]
MSEHNTNQIKTQEAENHRLLTENFILKNFSFLLLTESGISFCPENSVRFGRRAARSAPRSIDFSYVVRLLYQIRTYFQNK